MFCIVHIPPAVAAEMVSIPVPDWAAVTPVPVAIAAVAAAELGAGETEAIQLALSLPAHRLLLDDADARRVARRFAIPITGSAGVLLAAAQAGIITSVRPELDALVASGFHLSKVLYREILRLARE